MIYLVAIKATDGTPIFEFGSEKERQQFITYMQKKAKGHLEYATSEINI